jgi:hypothetical protein
MTERQLLSGPTKKTAEEREEILARQVQSAIATGGRLQSQTSYTAVIVKGQQVNHVLHLILTVLTAGLWAIVWIIVAATGGEKRQMITVDEFGNVNMQAA